MAQNKRGARSFALSFLAFFRGFFLGPVVLVVLGAVLLTACFSGVSLSTYSTIPGKIWRVNNCRQPCSNSEFEDI
jgi:hypothetical protein